MKFINKTILHKLNLLIVFFSIFALLALTVNTNNVSEKRITKFQSHIQKFKKAHAESKRAKLEALLSAREPRQDDDIPDPEVVYTLTLAAHKNKGSTCPYPLKLADSNCKDKTYESCDFNEGNGGDYIYLCVGRKKISQLENNEHMINQIIINTNNNDCGNLKLLDAKLRNSRFKSDDVYICYGWEENLKNFSNVSVYFHKESTDQIPANCSQEISKGKYLCFSYALDAPKRIEYSNLSLLTSDNNFNLIGKPTVVAEIDNDNGSGKNDNTIKRSIAFTVVKTSAWNIEHKFGGKIDTKFTVGTPIIDVGKFSVSASFDMSISRNSGEIKTNTDLTQIDYGCLAPGGKYYKCKAVMNKIEADIPYTITRKVYLHDGTVQEKTIKTHFKGVMTSALKFERCCFRFCDQIKDKLCPDYQKIDNGKVNCPKLENTIVELKDKSEKIDAPIINPSDAIDTKNLEKVEIDEDLNPSIITDIKVIVGLKTSCPNGYKHINCFDTKKQCDFSNNGSDNDKVYVCIKFIKLTKSDDQPINAIRVSRFNQDCGSLKLAKTSLEDDLAYICYGNDPNNYLAPITEMVLVDEAGLKKIDKSYTCDDEKIKDKSWKLCYKRSLSAPKNVELKNFKYSFEKMKKAQVGLPQKVNEIVVDSTSVSILVKVTKRNESSYKKSFDFGTSIGFTLSGSLGFVKSSASATFSHRRTSTTEEKDAEEITESSTIECIASEFKKIKCVSSIIDYKVSVPYEADLTSFDYAGKEMSLFKKKLTGVYEGIESSGISVRSCCLENCCTGIPNEKEVRPYCFNKEKDEYFPKDNLCSDLDFCYKKPETQPEPEPQNSFLSRSNAKKYNIKYRRN